MPPHESSPPPEQPPARSNTMQVGGAVPPVPSPAPPPAAEAIPTPAAKPVPRATDTAHVPISLRGRPPINDGRTIFAYLDKKAPAFAERFREKFGETFGTIILIVLGCITAVIGGLGLAWFVVKVILQR